MPQISASVSRELIEKIAKMASKEKRSFSEMVNLLLEEATKNTKAKQTR